MTTNRKVVFNNGYIYHIFNRGIDRRNVFTEFREYSRALDLIKYYRYQDTPVSYSKLLQQPREMRSDVLRELARNETHVNILTYCLMPNHFHLMLQQNADKGVPTFVSNFTNAYTKYFNTKHERNGPMFEGVFKAVFVESDEQLIHLSRYIHLNPVVASIINETDIERYKWSSFSNYVSPVVNDERIVDSDLVLSVVGSKQTYRKFVMDHVDYAKKLHMIKHLTFE